MTRKGADESEGLANSSLNTSRVPPQKGVAGDDMATNRSLPGNDQQKGLEATTNKAGSDPVSKAKEGRGGSNASGA